MSLQRTASLLFTNIEDGTLGMWLAGMSVRRLHWPQIIASLGWTQCCFDDHMPKSGRCTPHVSSSKAIGIGSVMHYVLV